MLEFEVIEPLGAVDSPLLGDLEKMRQEVFKAFAIPKSALKVEKKPTRGELIWELCWKRLRGRKNEDNSAKVRDFNGVERRGNL